MKRVYLVVGICLLVAILSVSAAAGKGKVKPMIRPVVRQQGEPRMAFTPTVSMVLRLKEKLELTDEQVKKLEALQAKIQAANEAVTAKRKALTDAVQSKAKESEIRAAATELGKALGDQAVLQVGTEGEIDGILTDAQKAKLKEQQQQRGMGMEEEKEWKSRRDSMRAKYSEEAFKRIDTNGDGAISLEEYKNQMGQMRERPNIERPKGPRKPE